MPLSRDLAERKKEIDTLVAGWLIPVFRREDPATGRILNGLSKEDFERVRAGYACADCLAIFTTYLITCPICGWTRDLQEDIQDAPDYWRQHIEDRDTGYAPKIARTNIDQVISEIMRDKNIEQIPLSKLKKKRRK